MSTAQPPEQPDWLHLMQYGYAPGFYLNRCCVCRQIVEKLDKRAITCRPCAETLHLSKETKK